MRVVATIHQRLVRVGCRLVAPLGIEFASSSVIRNCRLMIADVPPVKGSALLAWWWWLGTKILSCAALSHLGELWVSVNQPAL